MKRILLVLICLVPLSAFAAPAEPKPDLAAEKKQLAAVVEDFRSGIIAKDKSKLLALAQSGQVQMFGVMSPATFERARQKRPTATKLHPSTYAAFVDNITGDKKHLEEKFSNMRIETDGTIATVDFDYSFHVDAEMTNWGHEAWTLVKLEDGWKITSIVWSITF